MHLVSRKLLVGGGLITAAIVVGVVLGRGGGPVQAAACTIDTVAMEFGLSLATTAATVDPARNDAVTADLSAREPGATVAETRFALVTSAQVLVANGHRVMAMRLAGSPARWTSGPVGQPRYLANVACAVTLYDLDSGAFLISFHRLEVPTQ